MSWRAQLALNYRRDAERTIVHDRDHGPLRVLASLYLEGPSICHNVLVHPSGGIVCGDVLELELTLAAQAHAPITTPGAMRLYRSVGTPASQSVLARVDVGARRDRRPGHAAA